MDKEIQGYFREYEELKVLQKETEARLEVLKPKIMPYVPDDKEMAGETGVFYIQYRPRWIYSPAIAAQEAALKESKADEEAKGVARKEQSASLYYRIKEV